MLATLIEHLGIVLGFAAPSFLFFTGMLGLAHFKQRERVRMTPFAVISLLGALGFVLAVAATFFFQ